MQCVCEVLLSVDCPALLSVDCPALLSVDCPALLSVDCPALQYFSTLSSRKKNIGNNFLKFFSTIILKHFSFQKELGEI